MLDFYSILEIAKVNYYQRIRKHSFFIAFAIIMLFVLINIPAKNVTYETFDIDGYRGILNSAWVGETVAILTSTSLSMYGFFLINETINFDKKTRLGQIIGTTSVKNIEYLLGKAFSNFVLLITLLVFVMISSAGMFFIRAEATNFDIVKFVLPFIIIPVPSLLFVSILEVVFESLPFSNRWTNLLLFIGFIFLTLPFPDTQNLANLPFDVFGVNIIVNSMISQIIKINPLANTANINYGLIIPRQNPLRLFVYLGTNFTLLDILFRFIWIVLGLVLIIAISPFFERFSNNYIFNVFNLSKSKKYKSENNLRNKISNVDLSVLYHQKKVTRYDKANISTNVIELLKNELYLIKNQKPKWFLYVSIVFIGLGFLTNNPGLQLILWSINWMLPITIISSIGVKEYEFNTYPLIFSTRRPLLSQFFVSLSSRWIILIFYNIGAVFILIMTNSFDRLIVLLSGSIFLIGLASFCGFLFRSERLFETIYLFIWLIGPLSAVSQLDFIGVTQSSVLYTSWIIFLFVGIITIFFSCVLNIKRVKLSGT